MTGIIVHGEYRFVFYPGGASDVGSIMLSAGSKRVQLQMDPLWGQLSPASTDECLHEKAPIP